MNCKTQKPAFRMIECSISNLGKVVTGKTPSTKNSLFWAGDIPFITPKDIQKTKHIFDTERNLTFEGMKSVKNCVLPENAICVSCIGNIGYVAKTTNPAVTNQQINSIIVNDANNSDYVYYLMRSLWQRFKNYEGQSTTLSILNKRQFSEIKIFIHEDKAVQTKIANVLSSLDNKIELNEKINQNLEAQAQAIFKSWFVDFEPFGGKMPADWEKINLSDIADIVNGYSYKGNELQSSPIAMATIKNFDRQGGFKLDGFKEIFPSSKLKEKQKVALFDTLVAHTDLTQNADVIGNAEILLSKGGYSDVIISLDVVRVVPKKGLSKFLLAYILKDKRFKKHCLGYINGTTVLHLSKKALSEYSMYFPRDIVIVDKLSFILKIICKKIAFNVEENIRLSQLLNTLLPKLMSGEIDVLKTEL